MKQVLFSLILILCINSISYAEVYSFCSYGFHVEISISRTDSVLDLTYTYTNFTDKNIFLVDSVEFNEYFCHEIDIVLTYDVIYGRSYSIIKQLSPYQTFSKKTRYTLKLENRPIRIILHYLNPKNLSRYKRYKLKRALKVIDNQKGIYSIDRKLYEKLTTDYFYMDIPKLN